MSLLRPLAMVQITYHSGPAPRPNMRGNELGTSGGLRGIPKSGLGPLLGGGPRYRSTPARTARLILRGDELRAGRAKGPPKKAALDHYSGEARYWPVPVCAARPILRGDEQRTVGSPQGIPKKRPWTTIRGNQDTSPCPRALPDRY